MDSASPDQSAAPATSGKPLTKHQLDTKARLENRESKRKEAAKELAKKGFQRGQNDRVWDWVNDIRRNAARFLLGPAAFSPLISDPTLQENVIAIGKGSRLATLTQRLTQDCTHFIGALRQIETLHTARKGNSIDEHDLILSMNISQQYVGLIEEYERAVLPTMEELVDILKEAGLDTTSVQPSLEKGLSYKLIDPQG